MLAVMEISGIPLHPLIIHAAVVFTPLAAAVVVVFAAVPRWRWATRWPAVLTTLVALVSVVAAKLSGEALLEDRPELEPLVRVHEERGELLLFLVIGFAVLVLLGAWALGGPSGLASGRGAREGQVAVLDKTLPLLLVAGAVVVLVWVVLTGDAGSRAVWG